MISTFFVFARINRRFVEGVFYHPRAIIIEAAQVIILFAILEGAGRVVIFVVDWFGSWLQ